MTPSGVRTRSMCSPLGRSHSAMMLPTGSGSSGMARSASAIPSSRASVSSRRSWKAAVMPLVLALSMSMALAARISLRRSRTAKAAPIRAACLRSALAVASALADFRARRPRSSIIPEISMASAKLMARLLLGADQHQIIAVHHFGAVSYADQITDEIAALAHDEARIVAVETNQTPSDLAPFGIGDANSIAALEFAGDPGDTDG